MSNTSPGDSEVTEFSGFALWLFQEYQLIAIRSISYFVLTIHLLIMQLTIVSV